MGEADTSEPNRFSALYPTGLWTPGKLNPMPFDVQAFAPALLPAWNALLLPVEFLLLLGGQWLRGKCLFLGFRPRNYLIILPWQSVAEC